MKIREYCLCTRSIVVALIPHTLYCSSSSALIIKSARRKSPGVYARKCMSAEANNAHTHTHTLFSSLSSFLVFFLFFFIPCKPVASHSSISLSRKPISWYLNYARAREPRRKSLPPVISQVSTSEASHRSAMYIRSRCSGN